MKMSCSTTKRMLSTPTLHVQGKQPQARPTRTGPFIAPTQKLPEPETAASLYFFFRGTSQEGAFNSRRNIASTILAS